MPEEAGDQEWVELEVENPYDYIRHPREFIVLGNFSYRLKSGEQNYRLPRLFLPEERASRFFNFGDRAMRDLREQAKAEFGNTEGVLWFGSNKHKLRVYVTGKDVADKLPTTYKGVPVECIVLKG